MNDNNIQLQVELKNRVHKVSYQKYKFQNLLVENLVYKVKYHDNKIHDDDMEKLM